MRDVHQFQATETNKYYRQDGSLRTTTTYTRISKKSQRSDSLPTVPNPDGSYGEQTAYGAFFFTSTARAGEAAYRNVTYTRRETSGAPVSLTPDVYWGTSSMEPNIPTAVLSRARQLALDRMRVTEFNLGVFVGEIRDTVRTISGLLRDIANIVKFIKRGPLAYQPNFRTGSTTGIAGPGFGPTATRASEQWLRYQYGIKPLMSDIQSAIDIIRNGIDQTIAKLEVVVLDDSYGLPPPTGSGENSATYVGSVQRGVKIGYSFGVANPEQFRNWQLGGFDPVSVAWELTTLSFVVDWFLHVGDFLAGLQKPLGLRHFGGYETRFVNNQMTKRWQLFPNPSSSVTVFKEGWAEADLNLKAMRRLELVSPSTPLPYLDLELNLNQAVSALALIVSRRP